MGVCVTTLAIACGAQGGSSGGGADGGSMHPPPDTFVNAAVGGGSACAAYPSLKEWLQIGQAVAGHPNTVQDGGQDRNANVSVSCTVHPQGSGFDVELSAVEAGPQGGSLTITSPQGQGIVTTATSSGISASFVVPGGMVFRAQGGCTITYQYDPGGSVGGVAGDSPVPTNPPITAGRIWGHIKCPNATATAQSMLVCDAEADFMFEQCTQ
jgi:hypothetical protein